MSYITKSFTETLNLQRLQASDNIEWTAFVGYFSDKLRRYADFLGGEGRFSEDAAANAIANVYVSRGTFETVQHMVNYMFSSVRFEFYSVMKHQGRFMMGDDVLFKIDYYLSQANTEEMSAEERIAYEKWKDEAIAMLKDQAVRLPRRWRDFIMVYLQYGRNDLKKFERQAGVDKSAEKESAFNKLRELMRTTRLEEGDQLEQIRLTFRYLPRVEKRVLANALNCETAAEVSSKLKMTYKAVNMALTRTAGRLQKVYYDPLLNTHSSNFHFFRSVKDEKLLQIIKQEVVEANSNKRCRKVKFTRENLVDITLLREQKGMSWENIGKAMNCHWKSARYAYLENQMGGHKDFRELSLNDVVEIRRKHRTSEAGIDQLASEYGLPRGRVVAIIERADWKIAGNVVVLTEVGELPQEKQERNKRIVELFTTGKNYTEIASLVGCGYHTVMNFVKANVPNYKLYLTNQNLKPR